MESRIKWKERMDGIEKAGCGRAAVPVDLKSPEINCHGRVILSNVFPLISGGRLR